MSKAQCWILNFVGAIGALLILGAAVVGRLNERAARGLNEAQEQLNRAQQFQTTAQNLIVRIAQAAKTEPLLQELLTRHDLKVDLGSDAPSSNP